MWWILSFTLSLLGLVLAIFWIMPVNLRDRHCWIPFDGHICQICLQYGMVYFCQIGEWSFCEYGYFLALWRSVSCIIHEEFGYLYLREKGKILVNAREMLQSHFWPINYFYQKRIGKRTKLPLLLDYWQNLRTANSWQQNQSGTQPLQSQPCSYRE
jgi:hypothetical protein